MVEGDWLSWMIRAKASSLRRSVASDHFALVLPMMRTYGERGADLRWLSLARAGEIIMATRMSRSVAQTIS